MRPDSGHFVLHEVSRARVRDRNSSVYFLAIPRIYVLGEHRASLTPALYVYACLCATRPRNNRQIFGGRTRELEQMIAKQS